MTCREFWDRMPELEAEAQSMEHTRECAGCAALLERQQVLAMSLRRVATQRSDLQAPAHLEERLLEAFREHQAPVQILAPHGWLRRPAQLGAAAVVMAMAVVLIWQRPPQPPAPLAGSEAASAVELDSDFIPLPYAGEAGSADDAASVRVEMPRSGLIALGVPVSDGDAGEPVEAEILLGMGGAPRAVRVLQ